jgi:amino acid transporter
MTIYFMVCGGAYGLEDVVGASGPGMAILLILVTPLVWAMPAALMTAELSSAMPAVGGYYVWVKRALGPFWGFQAGWWTWLYTWVDNAIYPVLFVEYLNNLLKVFGVNWIQDHPVLRVVLAFLVIWPLVWINIRGTRHVGSSVIFFGVFVLAPFALLAIIGLVRWAMHPTPLLHPFIPPGSSLLSTFGLGLYVVMWNYLGWDAISTIGEEVDDPQRNYPRAMIRALLLITASYVFPVLGGLAVATNWRAWEAGYFPQIAEKVGGHWLAILISMGAVFSALGLFGANLLSASRVPFVLALDGYMPPILKKVHPKYGTPHISILLSAVIYSLCSLSNFQHLVVINVMLYTGALLLKFIALVVLRWTMPDLERPFKIPGGWPVLVLVVLCPAAVMTLAIVGIWNEQGLQSLLLPMVALASGPSLYPVLRKMFQTKMHKVF